MQSESISPAPYYPIRNNGFRSIELIDQVRSFENIIMFSYPVRFVRTDMNRYNFPILIEFEDDVQLKDIQTINDGIFACNHTLFLTPSNCNIYFFSKLDYDRTLINTKDAVYIKYFKDFKIYPTTSSLKMQTFPEIPSTASLLQLLPPKENTVDRTKGALYGYMLGIRLSITPELAHLNNLSQQIYDAITGALLEPNNSNKYLPQITSLLNQYKEIDPIEKESADTFKKKLLDRIGTKFALGVVIDILDMLNLSDNLKISWGLSSIYQTKDLKLLRDNIEKRTTLILRRNYSLNPISMDNVTVSDDSVNFTNAPLISEAIKWINTNNISQESLTRDKLSICAALGKIAKSVKGDIPDIQGMRDLYESIQYVQPFALHNIVDNEIRALSAFIYKGNSISGYLKYLRTKEITDYSLYLLLWGATVGYNEMDKNILSPILSPDVNKLVFDKMQLNNMYPCIPHSVYDLPEDLPECISNDADITFHTHNVEEPNVAQNTDKNENDINCEKNNTAITEETILTKVKTSIPDSILFLFNNDIFAALPTKAKEYYSSSVVSIFNGAVDETFISNITKLEYSRTKSKWANIVKNFKKSCDCEKTKINSGKAIKQESNDSNATIFGEPGIFSTTVDRAFLDRGVVEKYPSETNFLCSMDCLSLLDNKALSRLIDVFGYAFNIERDKDKALLFFSTMCINEGRGYKSQGEAVKDRGLFGKYTDELDQTLMAEIDVHFDEYKRQL